MAHFRGSVAGQSLPATRLGSKNSGLETLATGWSGGVRVEARVSSTGLVDYFDIYMTGGSNQTGEDVYIGRVASVEGAAPVFVADNPERLYSDE